MTTKPNEKTHALPRRIRSLFAASLWSGALLAISSCQMPAIADPERATDRSGSVVAAPITDAETVNSNVTGSSVVIGEPNILSTDDYQDGNFLQAQQTTLGQSATIQTLSLYVTAAAGKLRLGIYDATGPKGGPGAKKAETNEITPIVGWNTASVITPVLLSTGTYWLAYLPSSDSLHLRWTSTGSTMYFSYGYGPMPRTFSTRTKRLANHWSFYATLSPAVAANNPPTVGAVASASPNPVSGKTANVSVLGDDDDGEASLIYSWSATGPSAVSFSRNGTNAAKNSLATFAKAGDYVLQAVIADVLGQTVTTTVGVTVNQTLASIAVNPGSATVPTGGNQQFTASAGDQFDVAMLVQPKLAWASDGGGAISSSGLFTAANTPGGPFTVSATGSSLLGTASVVIAASSPSTRRTYATSFPLTEDPISENGSWINGKAVGLEWFDVVTTPGLAQGTYSPVTYSDPTALLTGTWGPDQTVQATVYSVNQTESYYQEVEIRLRSQMSAHSNTGYEINFRCLKNANAYMQIVRWNGALGSFTYISSYSGAQYGVSTGDVVKASIVGSTIRVYINDVLMGTGTDSTYSAGNPGIGFDYGCGSTYRDFGFTSLVASSL
jgi:hypothetical protein